jgi:hypothetical protein
MTSRQSAACLAPCFVGQFPGTGAGFAVENQMLAGGLSSQDAKSLQNNRVTGLFVRAHLPAQESHTHVIFFFVENDNVQMRGRNTLLTLLKWGSGRPVVPACLMS